MAIHLTGPILVAKALAQSDNTYLSTPVGIAQGHGPILPYYVHSLAQVPLLAINHPGDLEDGLSINLLLVARADLTKGVL